MKKCFKAEKTAYLKGRGQKKKKKTLVHLRNVQNYSTGLDYREVKEECFEIRPDDREGISKLKH